MGWFSQTIKSSIGKKAIMALTGAMLGLFILVHLAGNATTFWGREVFNAYASHLHALGFIIHIFEIVLLLLFLTHVGTAILLFIENYQARPSRYAVNKSAGGHSWGSRTMPYTGILILLFLVIHLMNFHFIDKAEPIAELVKKVLSRPEYSAFYIISMLLLALHVSHGYWSMFQSLGLDHPKYTPLLKCGALVLSIIIGTVFGLIPFLALFHSGFLV